MDSERTSGAAEHLAAAVNDNSGGEDKMASRDLVQRHRVSRTITLLIAIVMVCFSGHSFAWLIQSGLVPQVTSETAVYDPDGGALIIKGQNFQKGATVALSNEIGRASCRERV